MNKVTYDRDNEMDNQKIQLFVVIFCTLWYISQGQSLTVAEGRGISEEWQDESLEKGLSHPIAALMKRSKALRFYGLMGKRSGAKKPFQADKRNKGEMFVGLMGRSISGGASLTRGKPSATILEKPHKQDSSEDLVPILY